MRMAVIHWLQLALARGVGPVTLKRLMEATGSAEDACSVSIPILRSIDGIGRAKAEQIHSGLRAAADEAPRELERVQAMQASVVAFDDPVYPALLRSIHDPPPVLFVKGTLEPRDLNAIAIVGSRGCSFYGKEQAQRFAAMLAACGFTIASGGARGVDSAAHRGAMTDPNGRTIAVLGCGIDVVYPPENTKLFEEIAQRGALMSEYPIGTQPLSENFPRRNRIVSGMSRAVLVIEADERSGALITAHSACEQDRAVFALPGRIDNRMSAGPHKLIREGATLVTGVQDILDGLTPLPADVHDLPEPTLFAPPTETSQEAVPPPPKKPPVQDAMPKMAVTVRQEQILSAIDDQSTAVDTIVERTSLPAHVILQELTILSLKGLIRRADGQSYFRPSEGR